MAPFLFVLLLVSNFIQYALATYILAQEYSGDSFFDGWDFFTDADPTGGHVLYQSQADAQAKGLISIQSDGTGVAGKQVYIGVDSTNQAPKGRPSVRVTTQKTFQHGLILADIAHQPGGICGVWPAFWMVGSNWPSNGEIDIVEGVSTQSANQMTLHTDSGPLLSQKASFSGKVITPNCDVNAIDQPKNAGCAIADDSDVTFGSNFNAVGGGVYATQWTSEFIKIWFFQRDQIPADIQRGSPVPSSAWGTPNSVFQGSFDMDQHFKDLQIVFNTAFCGDWAGAVWSQMPECAALAPTCDAYVTSNPKAFEQAFWLVNSVQIFQDDGTSAVATTPGFAPSSTHTMSFSVSSSTPAFASPPAETPTSIPAFTSAPPFEYTVTVTMPFRPHQTVTGGLQPLSQVTNLPLTMGGVPNNWSTAMNPRPSVAFGPSSALKLARKRHGGAVLPAPIEAQLRSE